MAKVIKQLKSTADVSNHRRAKAIQQKYKCPICKGTLSGKITLDHCHSTGHTRSTLCDSCNMSEGKVKAGILYMTPKTNLGYTDKIQWLKNLVKYWEYHEKNPSGIIHPTFDLKTGKQKPVKRKRK